ncbi:hypothetical protein CTAYLR_000870 [Chrysophaeum taylorii]|uniref:Uncharacterized protein n=1 Tax=Chrysophaeum taylorii TaxID=2483200 RepID=A0AAD7URU1_9STRA|nr:hypothetical protein CTAYLR_000870 [Chrysophaeum taylorii]
MADDSMSASQLRARYHAGGTASDADLSAKQLRARYGIESNRPDFSTGANASAIPLLFVVAASGVAIALVFYLLNNNA